MTLHDLGPNSAGQLRSKAAQYLPLVGLTTNAYHPTRLTSGSCNDKPQPTADIYCEY